jgi:transcription elongation factor GreA-like protein/transcription elongation GreA/GreB family factor
MEYLKQFHNHLATNNLPQVLSLWQEYCLSDEVDAEEFHLILKEIKGSSFRDTFGPYAQEALLLWEGLPNTPTKHEIVKLIFDLQTTNDKDLAEFAWNYLTARYTDDQQFQQKMRLVGLRERISFQNALTNFEILTHMKKGNFFLHTGGWGVGEVVDVSMLREQITLEFDYVAGQKELSFFNAFKTLLVIPKDHFLARRFGDADNFERFAKENPVETVRMILRDLGPKTAQEIKDEICDLIIPEKDWARWWQMTRMKLKKDTFIQVPESLKDNFVLRAAEVSHEERLEEALRSQPDVATLIEMIYSFLRDFPQSIKNEEFKTFLKKQLTDVLSHTEITASQELQLLFTLQDLGHEKAKNLTDLVAKLSDVERIMSQIHILAYKKRLLVELKKARSDWATIYVSLLYNIDQNTLRDYILEALLEDKKEALVAAKIEELIDKPTLSPATFVWYFQKVMAHAKYPYADQEGWNRCLEAFFTLLYKIEGNIEERDLVKKMLQFLTTGRFANLRRIFQGASLEVVKEVLLLCTKCQSLSDHDIKILHSLAEVVHPSLASLRKKGGEEPEEEIVWTTQEGYQKIKARIEQIATIETVENAKEIEVARSHGDLRENSEYKFALEKRSRLQGELRFLSDQIKGMRVLTKVDIDTNQISVGTVVSLKNPKGETTTYTLLGPWDADPDRNVLSFQSKLAQTLLGQMKGATVTVHNEPWEVTAIESYL